MELVELEQHVARITYKPGCRFRLHGPDPFDDTKSKDYWYLVLELEVEDVHHPGKRNFLTQTVPFHRHLADDLDFFDQVVLQAIEQAEIHEAREWLKIDGVAKFDPHKEGSSV